VKCEPMRREIAKRKSAKYSKDWPMIIAKGHISEGE
jgi:hypothetical protein